MHFKLLSFKLAASHNHFEVVIRFKPSLFGLLIGRKSYVSKFIDNESDWFEIKSTGKQFICCKETSRFLSLLRKELELGYRQIPKQAKNALKIV